MVEEDVGGISDEFDVGQISRLKILVELSVAVGELKEKPLVA